MYIVGVDGGGTHTRVELRNMQNVAVRRGEFGPFNLNAIGETAFRSLLREVFVWCGDMTECARICIGGAGISNPRAAQIIEAELQLSGFRGSKIICGDHEIALRGAMDGPGVAVIAGTGSICIGKNDSGRSARSGGFGHLIDDGGSGYALGRDVLSCAVRVADGRAESSGIFRAVCDRLKGGVERVVPFVYGPETDKAAIAKFSEIALEQACLGDLEALRILRQGAEELAHMVSAVQNRLDMPGCRIALLGGLIATDNPYRGVVAERLSSLGTVVFPEHDALWGAAQMAWELK